MAELCLSVSPSVIVWSNASTASSASAALRLPQACECRYAGSDSRRSHSCRTRYRSDWSTGAADGHFFRVLTRAAFGVGALECPLFLTATASPLSVSSTLWTGWPPTISQPFCAARVMALLSISSSLTLMTWETLATDAHCGRLPSMMAYAALQMRMARGS